MLGPELTAAIARLVASDPTSIDRPDTLAWLLLALRAVEADDDQVSAVAVQLNRFQETSGVVPVHHKAPDAYWPTLLASAAWHGLPKSQDRAEAALQFVLQSQGKHWSREGQHVGHDTSIVGWSWVADTHSWVIPTSLAMLVLRLQVEETPLQDQAAADRLRSGRRMLLDRQLPEGGWNYGNTVVFRNTLKPLPEETAWALAALAADAERDAVDNSLTYLNTHADDFVAPITLSAALLAWFAWGEPINAHEMAERSLKSQTLIGPYPIAMVAQLVTCSIGPQLLVGRSEDDS